MESDRIGGFGWVILKCLRVFGDGLDWRCRQSVQQVAVSLFQRPLLGSAFVAACPAALRGTQLVAEVPRSVGFGAWLWRPGGAGVMEW
jgi:hypothetical protein